MLKRIMKLKNKEKDEAFVEDNYDKSITELTWQLATEQLVKANGIHVEEADVLNAAKEAAREQFARYGMMHMPDEALENYAKEMMKKQESIEEWVNRAIENKLIATLKTKATLNNQTVSVEEFNKLVSPQ